MCPPLVEMGLTDLSKTGGGLKPPSPPACNSPVPTAPMLTHFLHDVIIRSVIVVYWAAKQQTLWVIAPWWFSISLWQICIAFVWPRGSLLLPAPSSWSECICILHRSDCAWLCCSLSQCCFHNSVKTRDLLKLHFIEYINIYSTRQFKFV
jgi:hypothetical protein